MGRHEPEHRDARRQVVGRRILPERRAHPEAQAAQQGDPKGHASQVHRHRPHMPQQADDGLSRPLVGDAEVQVRGVPEVQEVLLPQRPVESKTTQEVCLARRRQGHPVLIPRAARDRVHQHEDKQGDDQQRSQDRSDPRDDVATHGQPLCQAAPRPRGRASAPTHAPCRGHGYGIGVRPDLRCIPLTGRAGLELRAGPPGFAGTTRRSSRENLTSRLFRARRLAVWGDCYLGYVHRVRQSRARPTRKSTRPPGSSTSVKHPGTPGTIRSDFHPATFPTICGRLHGAFLAEGLTVNPAS